MSKKYLDLAGLSSYDQKIKEYIDDGDVTIDSTLTQAGQAADAKKVGDEISDVKSAINNKVPLPTPPDSKYGSDGQFLRSKGNGGTEWVTPETPSETQVKNAVYEWMDENPDDRALIDDNSIVHDKLVNGTLGFVIPQMYGAKGDGITDDTQALKSAITSGYAVFIPAGTYKVTSLIQISNASGLTIIGANGAIIEQTANNHVVLMFSNCSNVTVGNFHIVGCRHTTTPASEFVHAIGIYGCTNVLIDNMTIDDAGGDGIEIAGASGTASADVKVCNTTINHSNRNGISVVSCDGAYIDRCVITNTDGTNPKTGIDIEPNTNADKVKVRITNCITKNNDSSSVGFHAHSNNFANNPIDIVIDNVTSIGDNANSGSGAAAFYCAHTSSVAGTFTMNNCKVIDNLWQAFSATLGSGNITDYVRININNFILYDWGPATAMSCIALTTSANTTGLEDTTGYVTAITDLNITYNVFNRRNTGYDVVVSAWGNVPFSDIKLTNLTNDNTTINVRTSGSSAKKLTYASWS